jgi:hypothetical protein
MRPALTSSGTTALILLALCALPGGAQTAPSAPVRTPAEVLFLANAAAGPVARDRGQLLGYVSDPQGRPQPGAVVEVRSEGLRKAPLRSLTTSAGLFQLSGLDPGTYYVQVGKGQRVAARQKVEVHASERALLLINLPALLAGMQFGPPPGASADAAFTWALRQSTLWRPILHLNDGVAGLDEAGGEQPVEGMVALTAGSGDTAFSGSDLATTFRLKTRALGSQLGLSGEIGTNGGIGGTNTQVTAQLTSTDASNPSRIQIAVRQISVDGLGAALPPLREFSLNYANAISLGDSLRVQYGSMLNAVSMTDTVATWDPYVRAVLRVGAEGELEMRAEEGVPPVHFAGDYASLDDTTPHVSLDHGRARLERAQHQELRYSESLTPTDTVSVAVFNDHYRRTAVNGSYTVGGAVAASQPSLDARAGLLPDLLNNMFLANGGDYGGWGYRFTFSHQMSQNWQAALGYSAGAVLAPLGGSFTGTLATSLAPTRADAFTVKLTGVTPLTHTQLICSYRALSRLAATGLDLYDDTAAEANSYANVFLRQPLPGLMGANGRLAALVEIHNLLAQGYIPMLGSDGRTLYLVQSARSLRGGLTFSF